MRWTMVAFILLLAGCTGAPMTEDTSASPPPPPPEEWPKQIDYDETDCFGLGVIFHVPLTTIQSWLPEGYTAEPASDTYARAGAGMGPYGGLERDVGLVALEAHGCSDDHGGAYLLAVIKPMPGHDVAAIPAYEIAWAGHDPTDLRREHGWPFFGDHVDASLTGDTDHMVATARVDQDGEDVISFDVETRGASAELLGGLARTWYESDNGTLRLEWPHITGGERTAILHQGGPMTDCTLDAPLIWDHLSIKSCQDAVMAGYQPLGFIIQDHDMEIVGEFGPGVS